MNQDKEQKQVYTQEPTLNLKCIVFTLVLVLGYWFLPKRNKWVLIALLYLPYLAMAWYDYFYACERNLGPTYLALFYAWNKPPESKQIYDYNNWDPKIKKRVLIIDLIILGILILLLPAFLKWDPK